MRTKRRIPFLLKLLLLPLLLLPDSIDLALRS